MPANRNVSDPGSKVVTVAMEMMTVVTEMERLFIMGTDDRGGRMTIIIIPIEIVPPRLIVWGLGSS